MRRFGPSGSLMKKNIALEIIRAVIPKMSDEIFFDLKYMVVIISEICSLKGWDEVGTILDALCSIHEVLNR